ncbi:DNA-binding protein, partial [Streptomyces sp. NPDC049577]
MTTHLHNPPRPQGSWRTALGDRLPVWLRVRCGIEPRTLAALAVVLVAAVAVAGYQFWTAGPRTVRAPAREAVRGAVPEAAHEAVREAPVAAVPPGAAGPTPGRPLVV